MLGRKYTKIVNLCIFESLLSQKSLILFPSYHTQHQIVVESYRLRWLNRCEQLLLLVGAKLEHVIARLAQESDQKRVEKQEVQHQQKEKEDTKHVKPSDKFFWFNNPRLVLNLIHFILFQNSFEIAFFFWIWVSH